MAKKNTFPAVVASTAKQSHEVVTRPSKKIAARLTNKLTDPIMEPILHINVMQKTKSTDINGAPTAETTASARSTCPHWCRSSRSCLLVKEGLFLPIVQHVASYCLSSHYPSCLHYQLLAGADGETGRDRSEPSNRRRSIRVPSTHTFRFSEITGHDQIPGLRENDAWTIDLSDHGIRFASRQMLTADTAIRFFLEADDSTSPVEGTGRVVWCEPLENTPLFHAGITFTNPPDPASLPHHRHLH